MVRAPDIDHHVESAGDLVVVVGDVGSEIGQEAIGLAQDAVLVVTVVGGPEPQRSVLFIGPAFGQETVQGFLDLSAVDQAFFREPVLVLDAKIDEVLLDAV
jgi:hypothetical protein